MAHFVQLRDGGIAKATMSIITGTTLLHSGWSRLVKARVRLSDGVEVEREVEDHGSAVAVLPYCPGTRSAILVSQLRTPVLLAASLPDLLEVPAGRVESANPEADARREVMEEAGIELGELDLVADVWSMPGVSTERIKLFLAAFRPEDRVGPGGGLADEEERIRVVEMDLATLAAMADRREITDMKTLTLLLALRLRQPDLFAA